MITIIKEQEALGFQIKCNKCNSLNIYIDFEEDIFWCNDCDNMAGYLDYGKKYEKKN